MSNLEEEQEPKEKAEPVQMHEGHDIEFEDTVNIDEIQQSLQKHMEEDKQNETAENKSLDQFGQIVDEEPEYFENAEVSAELEDAANFEGTAEILSFSSEQESPELLQNATPEIDSGAKKYVIYIDPENISFMESLSVSERKDVINTVLKEQEDVAKKQKAINQRKTFMRHIIFASIVFIFGFPALFFVVNKSMEAAMLNYQQAEKNFSTLYKDKGKIRPFFPKAAEKFKY